MGACGKLDGVELSRPSFRSEVFAGHLPGTRLSPRHFSQPRLTCPNPSCFQGLGLMSFPSSRNHGLETGDTHTRVWLGHCDTIVRLPATHLISQSLRSLIHTARIRKSHSSPVDFTQLQSSGCCWGEGESFEVLGFYLSS